MNETAVADESVVVLEGVEKTYKVRGKEPVQALRGVDLRIPKGSMVAIKGPSGSGKTTLLLMIGALSLASDGTVVVNGRELKEMSQKELTKYRAKSVGFVFQNFNLIPNLTAEENVKLPMEALGVSRSEQSKRAAVLLEAVGMEDRATYKPSKLSGGQQQRVAIARALANDPAIILADEPTGNLDHGTGQSIVGLLDKLRREQNTTVIIVTHAESVAERCDRTYTIKDGRITSEADTRQLRETETKKRELKIRLSIADKIVDRLFDAGYLDIESIASARPEDVARALDDRNKAERICKKAAALVLLEKESDQ